MDKKSGKLAQSLRHVHWNFHVQDKHFAIVKQVTKLESVAFHRPSQVFITRIGPWINSNPAIRSLSIKETRGFELELLDAVCSSLALTQLQRLELGRGHEFSSGELLRLLQGIPNLEYLNIFYDEFQTMSREDTEAPLDLVGLTRLQTLIVRHQGVGSSANIASLQSWISIVAGESPLHTLTIVADDEREIKWHKKADFFCSWPLLQTLDIRYMHLAYDRFSRILKQCKHLESVVLRMSPGSLVGYSRGIIDHDLEVVCGPPDRRVRYPLATYLTRKYKAESRRNSAVRFFINHKSPMITEDASQFIAATLS
ncbi:hypothetical protein EWM64_g2150 [Hericium alpestre]|uniref:F-box domain-containing protein n=1 Tax=Hericium alpestre TaxID=135208 RepID=A0A4Z0A689_9AGAM|nr:hypothetical protein EWM64_g2150 [Hericium alpestre]